jgi:hypothetical protein
MFDPEGDAADVEGTGEATDLKKGGIFFFCGCEVLPLARNNQLSGSAKDGSVNSGIG